MPIHVYDMAPLDANGCLLPGNEVTGCTITSDGGNLPPSEAPWILLGDYGSTDSTHFDASTGVHVLECPTTTTGFLYVN